MRNNYTTNWYKIPQSGLHCIVISVTGYSATPAPSVILVRLVRTEVGLIAPTVGDNLRFVEHIYGALRFVVTVDPSGVRS